MADLAPAEERRTQTKEEASFPKQSIDAAAELEKISRVLTNRWQARTGATDCACILRLEGERVLIETGKPARDGTVPSEVMEMDADGSRIKLALANLLKACRGLKREALPPPVVQCEAGMVVEAASCYAFPCWDKKTEAVNGVVVVPARELSDFRSQTFMAMLGSEPKPRTTLDTGKWKEIQYRQEGSKHYQNAMVCLDPDNGRIIQKTNQGECVFDLAKEIGVLRERRAKQFTAHKESVEVYNAAVDEWNTYQNSWRSRPVISLFTTRPEVPAKPADSIDWYDLKTLYSAKPGIPALAPERR